MSSDKAMAAKARAMFGTRLTESDYMGLLQKTSVPDIAYALKHDTYYAESLEDINEKAIHRGQLEALVRREVFVRLKKLMQYADKKDEYFIRLTVIDSEIELILMCLKYLITRDHEDRHDMIQRMPIYISKYFTFSVHDLSEVETYEELEQVLKGTAYEKAMKLGEGKKIEEIDYIALEHALHATEYEDGLKLIAKYGGSAAPKLKEMLLAEAELDNITIIYRLKKYFKVANTDIMRLMSPYYLHFNEREINRLIKEEDADGVLAALQKKYHAYIHGQKFEHIEHYNAVIQYNMFRHNMAFEQDPDVVLMAFIGLSKIEIRNVINIIEGVRYRVSQDRVKPLLVY